MKLIPEKLSRKILHRKGHGIHSPFVFNLVINVIEEKKIHDVFENIENCRKDLLNSKETIDFIGQSGLIKTKTIGEITAKETQSNKYGALLFRLVNFFRPESVLQIGGSSGIMSLYLAASSDKHQCYILEDRNVLVPLIREQHQKIHAEHTEIIPGEYIDNLKNLLKIQNNHFDLIFLNTARNPDLTQKILEMRINTRILIIDGIRKNKRTKQLWEAVTSDPHARITIDLYYLGIAIFENKFYKKNYKAYFDNGKIQNIYKNRRQRLNFFNWRKKSEQKQS